MSYNCLKGTENNFTTKNNPFNDLNNKHLYVIITIRLGNPLYNRRAFQNTKNDYTVLKNTFNINYVFLQQKLLKNDHYRLNTRE